MTESIRRTPIEEMCEMLHSGRFVLTAESRDTLSLRPRAGVSNALAEAIRQHRSRLIDFLYGRPACAPYPCSYCCGEFVSTPEERCQDCEKLRGQPLRMRPNSPEEQAFLHAYEIRQSARKTLPTVPRAENRRSGTVAPQTVPPYATTT
jgi:DNA mismatch repair protein MutH